MERKQPEQEPVELTPATPAKVVQNVAPRNEIIIEETSTNQTSRKSIQRTIQGIIRKPTERRKSNSSESENEVHNKRSTSPKKQKSTIKANSEPIVTRYGRTIKSP